MFIYIVLYLLLFNIFDKLSNSHSIMTNFISETKQSTLKKTYYSKRYAWLLLIISVSMTCFATFYTKQKNIEKEKNELLVEGSEIRVSILSRLHAHAQLLRAGTALIEASDSVDRKEWQSFYSYQKIEKNLPGVHSVGYAMLIRRNEVPKHEETIRRQGFPRYKLFPKSYQKESAPITYVHSFKKNNPIEIGYDLLTDSILRVAMEDACNSNTATLSGKLLLSRKINSFRVPGIVMFVPLYYKGMKTNTIPQRQAAIKGWIYSPYIMKDLVYGILGHRNSIYKNHVEIKIYDNGLMNPSTLLYDSYEDTIKESKFSITNQINLHANFKSKHLLLIFSQTRHVLYYFFEFSVLFVFFSGIAISLLTFLLTLNLFKKWSQLKMTNNLARDLKANLDKRIALYNAIPDAILLVDSATGNIEEINSKAIDQYGYTHDEFICINKTALAEVSNISNINEIKNTFATDEKYHKRKNGELFPVEITSASFLLENNQKTILVTRDITLRKRTDDLIKATLNEKEILLREVHHRVKNNLQIVSSLLNLQSNTVSDSFTKDILWQSRNRIRSIALVHEKLYQSGNFAEINFKEYTKSLIHELFRVYVADPGTIHTHLDIENINLPLSYALPCGLIMNEILSNSLKYAFPENFQANPKPTINIALKTLENYKIQLIVSDNGIGLPEDYKLTESKSLGLYLIHILSTEQLEGKLDISIKKGSIFTITFNSFQK